MTRRGTIRLAYAAGGGLVLVGLLAALVVGQLLWGGSEDAGAAQRSLAGEFDAPAGGAGRRPVAGPRGVVPGGSRPLPGHAVARLHIPRLKARWVVVEGVGARAIRHAPGHFPRTALPGQVGNFAVAGHRVRGVFWDLDRVRVGDPVVAESRSPRSRRCPAGPARRRRGPC